jgi:hypothetical protein
VYSDVLWDNAQGYDGNGSIKIPIGASTAFSDVRNTAIYSRVFHLKPNKKYTFSVWAKTSAGKTANMRLWMVNSFAPFLPSGFTKHPDISKSVILNDKWQRFSVSGYALDYPTSDYNLLISNSSDINDYIWIDNVQLEEGDLSDFSPSSLVEAGISIKKISNIYYIDESLNADLYVRNNTKNSITKKINYEIYDYLNRNVKKDSVSASVNAESTNNFSIVLPAKFGIFRIVSWVEGVLNSEREITYSIIPRSINLGLDSTSYLGIHANYFSPQLEALQKMGIKWIRTLSLADYFEWKKVEPTEGNFIFNADGDIASAESYGFSTMGTIGYSWPSWADVGGKPDLTKWGNFVS